jgi:hypothetical protein
MSTVQKHPTAAVPARERVGAGEYGEGAPHEATGVGPRTPGASEQRLNDQPGHADTYGNVAPGRYGVHGYSSSPGHPNAGASEAVPARGQSSGREGASASACAERDDQLRELIRQRLTEDPTLDASDIRIEVQGGRVTLVGTVASAPARAEIEQTVENCGAAEIDNRLRPLG